MQNIKQAFHILSCLILVCNCYAQSSIFERYRGEIKVKSDTIEYDGTFLIVSSLDDTSKTIFEKGIFYPAVLAGKQNGEILTLSKNIDTSFTKDKKPKFDWAPNYLRISNLRQISSAISSSRIKVFKFWVFRRGIINPSEYTFTLMNKNSTETTDLKTFIDGSNIVSFKFVSIII